MIQNDEELEGTLQRVRWFLGQVAQLRRVETNPTNYRLASAAFLAEVDRMNGEVREYLSRLPTAEEPLPGETVASV
jgi:hypothetical protein